MVQLVVLVNLFFVPVVCLYQIYKVKGKAIAGSMELLFHYCIVTSCNIPAAKVVASILKRITGTQIFVDSGYYTLAALFSATLMAWIYLNVHVEIAKEEEI